MSKKQPPIEQPETPDPLPAVTKAFIDAVTPKEKGPAEELTARFRAARSEENIRGLIIPGSPKSGPEYLVELRIREWMYRMEREATQNRKEREAAQNRKTADKDTPNTPKPPAPPKP